MTGLLLLLLALVAAPARPDEPAPLRVATFNIRYGSADDGPDRWELRRPRVARTLAELDADLVGLQEAEAFQVRWLLEQLPRYAATGVHRDDGRLGGEACPLLFDRTRFTLAESRTVWLSDTPEVPGSRSYGNVLPRIATRARLVEFSTGRALSVIVVHLDHASPAAREASARQLLETSRALLREGEPLVLLGDFNATLDSPPLELLLAPRGPFRDALAEHLPDRPGTFTGFDPASDGGPRTIDHLLLAGPGRVLAAGIDTRRIDGRYPSDHFPVWMRIDW